MKVRDIENVGMNPHDYVRTLLGHRNVKRIANNTQLLVNDDDSVSVWFHKTEIIRAYANGRTVLRTGGYETVTTKQRLNAFLPRRTRIASEQFVWFVWYRSNGYETEPKRVAPFYDGIALTFDCIGRLEHWTVNGPSQYLVSICHKVALSFTLETSHVPSTQTMRAYLIGNVDYCHLRDAPEVLTLATDYATQMVASGMRTSCAA